MSEKEFLEKNIELSSELSRYIIAHPEIGEKLSADCEIVFLVDSDRALTQYNLGLAKKIKAEKGKVIFVHVKDLLPKEASRLVEPKIETSLK